MANTLIVAENLLTRAVVTASSAPTAYPVTQLYDGQGATPFRHSVAAANDYVQIDLDTDSSGVVVGTRYRDGGFEAASLALGGWTSTCVGAGNTAAVDAAQKMTGAQSCKLVLALAGAGNKASAVKVIDDIPSGQRRNVVCALRGDATLTARARVYCPETAQYLKSDGTWDTAGAAAVDVWSRITAVFAAQAAVNFTMPTYSASRMPRLTLWLIAIAAEGAATGSAWVDDFYTWPSADTLCIHGHNLGPVILRWYASATGAFAGEETTVESSIAIVEKRIYWRETVPSDLRYHRISTIGTNHAAGWYGELALGQAVALQRTVDYGIETERNWPQERTANEYNEGVVSLANIEQENKTFSWQWFNDACHLEFVREAIRRSGSGGKPIWIVPDDTVTDVLFGRFGNRLRDTQSLQVQWQGGGITFAEEPYPRWPS